jgi:nicotinate dehydrogenase subunit A
MKKRFQELRVELANPQAVHDRKPRMKETLMAITLMVNGERRSVPAAPDTPLLYVLRNDLELNAAKYGCGVGQCGSCNVILDGKAIPSCITPVSAAVDHNITTLEGLGTIDKPHPLQKAFMEEQAAQCGYCIPGMMMRAKALLDGKPNPSEAEIHEALAVNLCRCGTHNRIVRAIERAARGERA